MEILPPEELNQGKRVGGLSEDIDGPLSSSSTCSQVETVVYQLVRVDGDGRLVPATEDEVMEVEHILEDRKNEHPKTEHLTGVQEDQGSVSNEILDILGSPAGNSKMGSTLVSHELNPRCEFGNDNYTHPETTNIHSVTKELEAHRPSTSKPDFYLLKDEICLDNLTIRELQETFRTAFGRQTSVKDKLWLKRRITMGLTNSYDVPTPSFMLKERRRIQSKISDKGRRLTGGTKCETSNGFTDYKPFLSDPSDQVEDEHFPTGKRLRTMKSDRNADDEVDHMENEIGCKRVRKPTRRYIEELSVSDTRECNSKAPSTIKSSVHPQLSYECRFRPVNNVTQTTSFITRQDSLGGFVVRIPYVFRERRGRPRKDSWALMDITAIKRQTAKKGSTNWKEHDVELKSVGLSRKISDQNMEAATTLKGSTRRKHHRAWTLSEVMKLVEGVSRYGAGRWSEIKRLAFASYTYRTSVDLKDKWRNLLRASFSQGSNEKEAPPNLRKHSNLSPVPAPILVRVRELAEMQRQTGVDSGPSKLPDHVRKVVEEEESGFL